MNKVVLSFAIALTSLTVHADNIVTGKINRASDAPQTIPLEPVTTQGQSMGTNNNEFGLNITPPAPQKPVHKVKRAVVQDLVYDKALPASNFHFQYKSNYQGTQVEEALKGISQDMNALKHAYRVGLASDDAYQTKLFSTPMNPYIPQTLFMNIATTNGAKIGSCDLDASAACIVVEKASVNDHSFTRAYFLATAPDSKKPGVMRAARVDIDSKKFASQIKELAPENFQDGIYIYSAAPNATSAAQNVGALDAPPAQMARVLPSVSQNIERLPTQTYLMAKNIKIAGLSSEEAPAYWNGVDDLITKSTYPVKTAGQPGQTSCYVTTQMQQKRRFFIADVVGIKSIFTGSDEAVSRESISGSATCYLRDGQTYQTVKSISVKEYAKVRFGFVFTESKTRDISFGIGGWVNDLRGVFTMHDFAYITQASIDLPLVAVGATPLILSNVEGRNAIVASSLQANFGQVALNATFTIGGKLTIEVPKETVLPPRI